uniref:Uncharacterized protein n=1 Tax=Plectus sambesii TaxID=2011161 RepID=A0A914W0G5_9BILA
MDSNEEQCSIDEDEENSEVGEQTVEQEVVIGSPEKRPRIVQNVGIPAIWNFLNEALLALDANFATKKYVPPARGGMKRQIAAQVELLKQKMREALSSASKISLCVDLWSKRALTASFVGITAHFVDRGRRRLVRLLLRVKEIPGKHSAKNVAALVNGIGNGIFPTSKCNALSLTTDQTL